MQGPCIFRHYPLPLSLVVLVLLCGSACEGGKAAPQPTAPPPRPKTLADARQSLATTVHLPTDPTPAPVPPLGLFEQVHYAAPLGDNVAYITPTTADSASPAILWIPGGFDWNLNSSFWEPAERDNDQSAKAFRDAGIVLMLPALRGSNGNPGRNECMVGEVDDIMAAAEFLSKRPGVDPTRIYLGGHSTGGTLTLLTVETTSRFRAAFAFGPVADARHYGAERCLGADAPAAEWRARAAWPYLAQVSTPTWVIEGQSGNIDSIQFLMEHVGPAPVRLVEVAGRDHFSVLAPGSEVVAAAIVLDTGPTPNLDIRADAIAAR